MPRMFNEESHGTSNSTGSSYTTGSIGAIRRSSGTVELFLQDFLCFLPLMLLATAGDYLIDYKYFEFSTPN